MTNLPSSPLTESTQSTQSKPTKMVRLWNWRSRFIELITDTRLNAKEGKIKFSWDSTASNGLDCMSFCGQAVEAVTGVDRYKEWLNGASYTDMVSAYKLIRAAGSNNIDQLLRSLFIEKPLETVHTGDLVSVRVSPDGITIPASGVAYAGAIAVPPHFYCITLAGLGKGFIKDAVSGFAVG